jgi:hypothetical protein
VTLADGTTLMIRELKPKDYYFFNLINNDYPDITAQHLILLILMRLTGLNENGLHIIRARYIPALTDWAGTALLEEKVMKLEQWFELSFHMCKQRWDSSIEWLEEQPIPKILAMAQIMSSYSERMVEENKRAMRR